MTENNQKESTTNQPKKSLMSPILLLIIGLAVFVLGTVAAIKTGLMSPPKWLLKTMPASTLPLLTQTSEISSDEAKLSMMLESGRSGVCEITRKDNENEKMVYYIDGKKMKIVINDIIDEKPQITYILTNVDWQYTWIEGENEGTKMIMPSEDEVEEMQAEAEEFADSQNWDTDWDTSSLEVEDDDRYEVSCQYKNVDSSVFELPKNVEFVDLSEAIRDLEQMKFDSNDFSFDQDDQAEMEEWAKEMQEKFGIEE